MVVTMSNQHRSSEAFRLLFQNRKEGFERLSVWIIWRIFKIGTGVKTENNSRRVQISRLAESLAQPCYGCLSPSPRSLVVAGRATRKRPHAVSASNQMHRRENEAVINSASILDELRKCFVTLLTGQPKRLLTQA